MQHDFSVYREESLEGVLDILLDHAPPYCGEEEEGLESTRLLTELISMLSEAKTKSIAFRKKLDGEIDTVRLEVNYPNSYEYEKNI